MTSSGATPLSPSPFSPAPDASLSPAEPDPQSSRSPSPSSSPEPDPVPSPSPSPEPESVTSSSSSSSSSPDPESVSCLSESEPDPLSPLSPSSPLVPEPSWSDSSSIAAPVPSPLSDVEPLEEVSQDEADDAQKEWCGFKIVTDNVDFTITPSYQRMDKPKKSLHYVHSYAVKDRVNMSNLSDIPPEACDHVASDLLPTSSDISSIKEEFCILLSRYAYRINLVLQSLLKLFSGK